MTLSIDVYWSFRSPYCYLVSRRLVELQQHYDVSIQLRPVKPIAVRIENFFKNLNPMVLPYFFRDIERVAAMNGVPLKWPEPDPVAMNFGSGEVAKEQPYIGRLTSLGVAANDAGRGIQFAEKVSALIFGGTPNWHEGNLLDLAVASAGLNLAALDQTIKDEPTRYEAVIEANEAAQAEAGHWGVPLMVFDGEPFFGQDRFDVLMWRLRQSGLKQAAGQDRPIEN